MGLFGGRKRRTWATPEELARARQLQLADARQTELDAFKKNAPQFQSQQISQARRNMAEQLAGNVNTLNRNANSAGLLYSGRRAGNEAALRGESALSMVSERNAIAKRLKDQIDNTQLDITNARYGLLTNHLGDQLRSEQDGMQKMAQRQQQLSGLMQAGGYAAGGGFNQQPKTQSTMPSQSGGVAPNYNNANQRPWMTASPYSKGG